MKEDIAYPLRINRYIALQGWATRKDADKLISAGKVYINDKKAVLGDKVLEGDVVELRKRAVKRYTYLAYYKPRGIVSHSPRRGEVDVAEAAGLAKDVFPVGRLDKDSEGLMILTNDGRVTERLLHPRFTHEKEYRVTVRERIPNSVVNFFKKGVRNNNELLSAKQVKIVGVHTMLITLTEGKKHQVRRMCDAAHLTVEQLTRTRIMNITLIAMKPGKVKPLSGEVLQSFLEKLGIH